MKKKAITPFLFAAVAVLIISSCNNGKDDNKEKVRSKETIDQNTEFNWSDQNVISFSDIHNPMNGYASDDPEALDTSFINILFEGLLERDDVEFLDQVNEEKISAQQVKEQLNDMGFDIATISRKDIVALICKEEWKFDTVALKMLKTVTHIAPIARTYDSEGNERGKIKLFWVKLN